MRSAFLFFTCFNVLMVSAQNKRTVADSLYRTSLEFYRNRDLSSALSACEQSLVLEETAKTYYLNGLIFEAMKRDLRAVAAYEAALRLDPFYNEALFQKGLIYLNYGDPGQAVKDLSLLIDRGGLGETKSIYFQLDELGERSTSIATLTTLKAKIYYYRAQAYTKKEEYESALSDYDQAIALDSLDDYFVGRGLMNMMRGEDLLAKRDFLKAIELNPESQLAWYNLALVDRSTDLPEDLLADNSFAPTLGLLASQALIDEDYHAAIRYLTQAIENNPDPLHYINRGRAYVKLKKYTKAREDFNAARKIAPTRFECLHLIGNTYFYEKEHELAVSFYNQYLTLDPTNAMVWFNAAMSYMELDQDMDACHYLNRANNLGMVQAKRMIDKHCR